MKDVVKIKVGYSGRFVGMRESYTEEVDKEYWDSLTSEEKDEFLDKLAVDFRAESVECWAFEEEQDN